MTSRTIDPDEARNGGSGVAERSLAPVDGAPLMPAPPPDWPAPLAPDALHGLTGDFVRLVEPHTEADPVALLSQLLCAFGNIVGRGAYVEVEDTHHYANLYVAVVGDTSKARKGTAYGRVRHFVLAADPEASDDDDDDDPNGWKPCIRGGLSSGEGLIYHVRDAAGNDSGADDKRLFVYEPEFARVLRVLRREGNTLSPVLRQAWDDGAMATLTRSNPLRATNAHVSIVAHVTMTELKSALTRTDMANGFGNRFLWFLVRRSKSLPLGGALRADAVDALVPRLKAAIAFGQRAGRVDWDESARQLWFEVYEVLSAAQPGLIGEMTARAEAQVTRLALIYALLDGSDVIRREHLRAALAVWEYAEASVRCVFGDSVGNPMADKILGELRRRSKGLTLTDIHDLFGRKTAAIDLRAALQLLLDSGLVSGRQKTTGERGRPATIYSAVSPPMKKYEVLGD